MQNRIPLTDRTHAVLDLRPGPRVRPRAVLLAALPLLLFLGPARAQAARATPVDRAVDYTVEPDLRRCVSPLCGGYFVSRANRAKTRCADGSKAPRCYVAEIDWTGTSLADSQIRDLERSSFERRLVVRGRIAPWHHPTFGNLGELRALSVWQAATPADSTGKLYGVEDSGIVCVTFPCFSLKARLLNRRRVRGLSGLDLSAGGASDEQLEEARAAALDGALIAAGKIHRQRVPGTRRAGRQLTASQFYLPVEPLVCAVDDDCTASSFTEPVHSQDDCYCTTCARPVGITEAEVNEEQWLDFCQDVRLICPAQPCSEPRPVVCRAGACVFEEGRR